MNTITIDSGIYQFVANYAAKRSVSVKSIVESFILSLNDKTRGLETKTSDETCEVLS